VYYDTKKVESVKKDTIPNTVFNLHYVAEVVYPSQSGRRHITIKFLSKHFHKDGVVDTALDIMAPTDKDAMIWATEIRNRTERLSDLRKGIEFNSLSDDGRLDRLNLCDRHLRYVACDSSEEYRFGVIDLFQKWDMKKKTENAAKKMYNRASISAVNPQRYRDRFLRAITSYYFADDAKAVRQSFRAPISPGILTKDPPRRRRSQTGQAMFHHSHDNDNVDLFGDSSKVEEKDSSSSSTTTTTTTTSTTKTHRRSSSYSDKKSNTATS
jgi:hypothetical protein